MIFFKYVCNRLNSIRSRVKRFKVQDSDVQGLQAGLRTVDSWVLNEEGVRTERFEDMGAWQLALCCHWWLYRVLIRKITLNP